MKKVSARQVVPESAVYAGPPTLIRVGSVADVEVVPATSFETAVWTPLTTAVTT